MSPWSGPLHPVRPGLYGWQVMALMLLVETAYAEHPRTILSGPINSEFGRSVSGVGDFDGDGHPDFVIGAPGSYNQRAGTAHLYFGGTGSTTLESLQFREGVVWDLFGFSVASAGDVNGDGFADLVVGAPHSQRGSFYSGAAYVYWGGSPLDTIADLVLRSSSVNAFFGSSVSSCGDFDNDGYDDIIVGARHDGTAGSNTGRACLYRGGPVPDTIPDAVMVGEASGDEFGISVAGVGDINGDGFDDVVVGSHGHSSQATAAGRAYLFLGRPLEGLTPLLSPDLRLGTGRERNYFGSSIGGLGDVNRDGFDDYVIGAPDRNITATASASRVDGTAYLFFGGAEPDSIWDVELKGAGGYDMMFGVSSGTAGDANDDGWPDIFVAANGGCCLPGEINVYFGGPALDGTADFVHSTSVRGQYFGNSASNVGDIDGNSRDDMVVGEMWLDRAHLIQPDHYTPTLVKRFWVDTVSDEQIETPYLRWQVSTSDGVGGFRIYRAEEGAPFVVVEEMIVSADAHDGWYGWIDDEAADGSSYRYQLDLLDPSGHRLWTGWATWTPRLNRTLGWELAGPNPFSTRLRMRLSSPDPENTEISVFDVFGRLMAELRSADGEVEWHGRDGDGRDTAPGVYLIQARLGKALAVRRVVKSH